MNNDRHVVPVQGQPYNPASRSLIKRTGADLNKTVKKVFNAAFPYGTMRRFFCTEGCKVVAAASSIVGIGKYLIMPLGHKILDILEEKDSSHSHEDAYIGSNFGDILFGTAGIIFLAASVAGVAIGLISCYSCCEDRHHHWQKKQTELIDLEKGIKKAEERKDE